METQQPATPTDAGSPEPQVPQTLDDKILAKFGLTDDEPEQAETDPEATPAEGEVEAEPEVNEEEASPVVEELELKHNGEIKRVPKDEAIRLAQMGYDYEFKMQRVQQDAQRVQAMAQAAQARDAIRAQALDALAEVKSYERLLSQYANVDWDAENANDPLGASQKWMQYSRLRDAHGVAQQKVQSMQQPFQQASQQVDANWAALQEQKLLDRIPEWKDGTKRGKEAQEIMQTLAKDYGFAQEELGGPLFYDHRVIALLRDAHKFRQASASAKERKGQIQGLPQVAKPGAKPPPRSPNQQVGDIKRGLRQATSPGTRRALQDALIAKKFGLT